MPFFILNQSVHCAMKPTTSINPIIAVIKTYAMGYRRPPLSAKNKNTRIMIIAIAPSL